MHYMHDLKDLLCAELEDYAEKGKASGKMSGSDLDTIHKLTDTVKNILKIDAMKDDDYSEDGYYMGEGRVYGTSYAGRKRDNMGRYSRGYDYSNAKRHYVRGHYSRDDSKRYMMDQLEDMSSKAENQTQRDALQRCMDALERA